MTKHQIISQGSHPHLAAVADDAMQNRPAQARPDEERDQMRTMLLAAAAGLSLAASTAAYADSGGRPGR